MNLIVFEVNYGNTKKCILEIILLKYELQKVTRMYYENLFIKHRETMHLFSILFFMIQYNQIWIILIVDTLYPKK
jgi:hypothetical protein